MATGLSRSERRDRQRLNAAALAARDNQYRAERLLECVSEDEMEEVTGFRHWRCQYRYCLICGRRYLNGFRDLYGSRLEHLMARDCRLSFLTLTIPNVPWLEPELYRWMSDCFKKLRRRDPFRGRVDGAVSVIETDFYTRSQDYHPHIHSIISYQQCPPQQDIEEVWSELTAIPPDGFPISDRLHRSVWIEKINPESINQIVDYTFKFKPIEDAEAFAEYCCAVENIRLVNSYGTLRGGRF